ncbi:hypothetical protein Taro_032148 [Colocasia esculenta]|uniref:Uncharacterized protein n=1 Tax=Colocasia esculenta TaxID=4460 RepID=A0A843VWI8_COLES|nr:hypothetical protein [Colocasia esculenta]
MVFSNIVPPHVRFQNTGGLIYKKSVVNDFFPSTVFHCRVEDRITEQDERAEIFIEKLSAKQSDNQIEVRGPPATKAYDQHGTPTVVITLLHESKVLFMMVLYLHWACIQQVMLMDVDDRVFVPPSDVYMVRSTFLLLMGCLCLHKVTCLYACHFVTPENLNIHLDECRFMTPEDLHMGPDVCRLMTPEGLCI